MSLCLYSSVSSWKVFPVRLHVGVQEVRLTEAVRGIPQGSLHEGGGPQGPSSALRSMVPSALRQAKTVTTNRSGGKGVGESG